MNTNDRLLRVLIAIVSGYHYDPGNSDLDDEQPISVSIDLGEWKEATRLLHELSQPRKLKE